MSDPTATPLDAPEEAPFDPLWLDVLEDANRARGVSQPQGEPRASELAEATLVQNLSANPDLIPLARGIVRYSDFYSRAHGLVFHALCRLHEKGASIDEVSVVETLTKARALRAAGDEKAITDAFLAGSVGAGLVSSARAVEEHSRRIAEYSTARRIGRAARDIVTKSLDWSIPVAELVGAARVIEADASRHAPTAPLLAADSKGWADRFEDLCDGKGVPGLSTGFPSIDSVLLGMRGGQLILLAARPSVGKTALALCMCIRIAAGGVPVLFVSLEMTRDELLGRAVSVVSGVPYAYILKPPPNLSAAVRNKVGRTARNIEGIPLYVSDPPTMTASELSAHVRAEHARRKIQLVVVDYAQLVKPDAPRAQREQEVREVADALKALAKSLNVPVIALAQLNREVEKRSREPVLADLRESGALEQNADVVAFLHVDDDTAKEYARKGPMECREVDMIFRKVRSGQRDVTVKLGWTPGVVTYNDLTAPRDDDEVSP